MLDVALSFLAKSLNGYLTSRTGSPLGEVDVTRLVDDAGKWSLAEGKLGLSLLNVEEERILRSQLPETTLINGQMVTLEPPLKLNLSVIIAANFRQYDTALRHIALALTYFQAFPSFVPSEFPELDSRIEQLNVELMSLSFEQLNQVWAFVGGKQLPSIFYRVRMVVLQDRQPRGVDTPIRSFDWRVARS